MRTSQEQNFNMSSFTIILLYIYSVLLMMIGILYLITYQFVFGLLFIVLGLLIFRLGELSK